MRHAWWFIVFVSLISPPADAKCARWGLGPDVLTEIGATIAADGGIVVAATPEEDGELESGDVAKQDGWRLRIASRVASPTIVSLAPGLALYKLPPDAKDASMIDDGRKQVAKVSVGPKTATLAAPKIKKILHDSRQGKRPYAKVNLELSTPVPAGAIAIVLADAKGTPRSWGQVEAGKVRVLGYDRRRCQALPNGTIESQPGDKIVAYWIDASGRKSAASAATAITIGDTAAED